MTETLPVSEGRIPFGGAETWYRIVGEDERPALCRYCSCTAGRAARTTTWSRWRSWRAAAAA